MDDKNIIDVPARAPLSREERRRQTRIWYALAVVPIAGLAQMTINYATIDWSGETHNWWLPRVIPIPFLLLALVGVYFAYMEQRRPRPTNEETTSIEERTHFMARVALAVSAFISLLLLCQWIATFIVDPMK
jgi:hypothetical protein